MLLCIRRETCLIHMEMDIFYRFPGTFKSTFAIIDHIELICINAGKTDSVRIIRGADWWWVTSGFVSAGVFCIRESELKSRSHRVLVKESEKQTLRMRSTGKTPSCLICRPSKTKVQLNELEMVLFTGEHESKHGRAWNRATWKFILLHPGRHTSAWVEMRSQTWEASNMMRWGGGGGEWH